MPQFERYIGIDYSGAETPVSPLPGLRVYAADQTKELLEERPPNPPKHWTRRGLAEWLRDQFSDGKPTLVGIDHAFSFPKQYFEKYQLQEWPGFLDDFKTHWLTDQMSVEEAKGGKGAKRTGDKSWLRLTERWTAAAKSVFMFGVPGQVAPSTHAGLPWLRYLRQPHSYRLHFWPFDGWEIPRECSAIVEVYPSLWTKRFPMNGLNSDQQAARAVAAWMQRADTNDSLSQFLNPPLEPDERTVAEIEGWILGAT